MAVAATKDYSVKSSGVVALSKVIESPLINRIEMENGKIVRRVGGVRGDGTFFIPDVCLRGKKRRLDHLTWEEKVQRKKLKNRVAAQTSRDRKKAKLDELEETVKMLRERNDLLTRECSTLRSQNESLVLEVKRLCRDRLGRSTLDDQYCVMCQNCVERDASSVGSAVSSENPPQRGQVTSRSALPLTSARKTLVLFKTLILCLLWKNYLETFRLTITSTDWRNSRRVCYGRSRLMQARALIGCWMITFVICTTQEVLSFTAKECDGRLVRSKKMVGQASKNVGAIAAGGDGDDDDDDDDDGKSTKGVASTLSVGSNRGTYRLCPAISHCTTSPGTEGVPLVKKELVATTTDTDTVYGTYDESTNCITIIYPNEVNGNQVPIGECVQVVEPEESAQSEDSTCSNLKCTLTGGTSPAYTCNESMSPSSVRSEDTDVTNSSLKKYSSSNSNNNNNNNNNLADLGYESHDSPSLVESYNFHASSNSSAARTSLTDLWHESFSELFPSLA